MKSQFSIASRGMAAGWARSFFGPDRRSPGKSVVREASAFGEAKAVEDREAGEKK